MYSVHHRLLWLLQWESDVCAALSHNSIPTAMKLLLHISFLTLVCLMIPSFCQETSIGWIEGSLPSSQKCSILAVPSPFYLLLHVPYLENVLGLQWVWQGILQASKPIYDSSRHIVAWTWPGVWVSLLQHHYSLVPRLTVGGCTGVANLSPLIPSTIICSAHVQPYFFHGSWKMTTMLAWSCEKITNLDKLCYVYIVMSIYA